MAEDYLKNFENVIGGSVDDKLIGDGLANALTGNAGNDTLGGGAGNDTFTGGLGADTMAGGVGADHFRFNTTLGSTNIDAITDFAHLTDKIELENAIMTALGTTAGTLSITMFVERASDNHAQTTGQHIIYNKANGTLWYDSDGSTTTHAAVEFAVLGTTTYGATLTNADFLVV